ncbi:G1/S-specific cyclin-E-like [Mya arenaria]|uniref:G1/S-specific cyclin-E-like n=1 Tax=Mya arenaria TaxID=6604 RepID=UPI0022E79583|nr:G1/S-specific cyclin-E-like [Mya arenaria]XP_052815229.1 G1/S-specific cyclin-E-like [Mya arenaria]XP_052819251.1 G1/S-specific cyclin-E-like [Mya arenaria]XP_052819252.1 G1/S-specific cyclin-E-like [Mya arenaria]
MCGHSTKMSRKSSRMSSRSKTSNQVSICNKVSRKRKAEEELEGAMECNKRRQSQSFRIENQWVAISETTAVTTCSIVPSPESSPSRLDFTSHKLGSHFRFQNYFTTPVELRDSPLPQLDWADSRQVWQTMLRKELNYVRDQNLFDKHPALHARMRAILLDWLIEVCEVYKLHRETFYLATDFLDRFLTTQSNILKHQLQLLGITCLFIAAKLEEIYPPKLVEFAYVTDGACTEDEILDQELIILKAIKWDLSPVTANGWLNVYLQVSNAEQIRGGEHGFVFPQYSSHAFVQIVRLLDLCMLDIESLQFQYSVLAAAALYHNSSKELALSVSGYKWLDILPCVQWMAPFAVSVRELGQTAVKFFPNIQSEDSHIIQTHVVDIQLLEKAQLRRDEIVFADQGSPPDLQAQVITQLTPPSDKKGNISPLCEKIRVSPSCDDKENYIPASPETPDLTAHS